MRLRESHTTREPQVSHARYGLCVFTIGIDLKIIIIIQ